MANIIRILSTSDIHGYIAPYSYSDGKEASHGLARVATLVKTLRDPNTILIDNGDTIEGSPLTFYHYATRPNEPCIISQVMKQMNYDYAVVGNHDFNYGGKALLRHIKTTGAIWLTANVLYKRQKLGPDYVVRKYHGKTLALFGLTTQFTPNWEDPEAIKGFEFLDAYETALRVVAKIQKEIDPDYIVCSYHGGFERRLDTGELSENNPDEDEAYRICKNIKGIDAIITGHQHRELCGELFGKAYTQPFQHGEFLSCLEIDTDTDKITPSLIPVTAAPDPFIMQMCQKAESEVQSWLDTTLGTTEHDLLVHSELDCRLHKSQLATLFNLIQMDVTGADLSGVAIFLKARGLDKNITMRSLMTTYFFPNTLFVKKINGRILREYLETCAQFWTTRNDEIIINPQMDFPTPAYHNYDMVDGVEYTIKASNLDGHKIISLTRNGIPVEDNDEFTLAVNSYRAGGSGGFDMIKNAPTIKEINRSVVDIIAVYIREMKVVEFEERNNIEIIK